MKVALIVPENDIVSSDKFDDYQWNQMWEFRSRQRLWSSPSLSLLTVAGMLPESYDVEYIDLNYVEHELKGFDLAVFSPSTSQVDRAYSLAGTLRVDGVTVAMGGPHVSMLPEEAGEYCDAIFIGECEESFPRFLVDLERGKVKKVYEKSGYPTLDKTPIPRYDLVKQYDYKSIPMQTSRGCPHQCEFCVSSRMYGKRYRRKSFEQVKAEIDTILAIWPRPLLFFSDDNIFLDAVFSSRLIEYLKGTKARWYAFSDARIADKRELLEGISRSGCSQLLIGFESLSSDNLAQINRNKFKRQKRDDYKRIIETIQSYGIGVVGSFVLGLDEDTPEVFDELYQFVEDTNLYATNITIVTPFPGTGLYKKLKDEGRIVVEQWSRYNGFELTFKTNRISKDEFDRGMVGLYKRLDSPERIVKVLNHFKEIINSKNEGPLKTR